MRVKRKLDVDNMNAIVDKTWDQFKYKAMKSETLEAMEIVTWFSLPPDALYKNGTASRRIRGFEYYKSNATGQVDVDVLLHPRLDIMK